MEMGDRFAIDLVISDCVASLFLHVWHNANPKNICMEY